MWKSYRNTLVSGVVLAAATACGGLHSGGATPDSGPTTVVFRNESLDQADLFAVRRSAGALRLGTIMAGRTDTLEIQKGTVAPGESVDFVARLLTGKHTPHSGMVAVSPGQVLTITLPQTENILSVLPGQPQAVAR
jgi:hypothetical protein